MLTSWVIILLGCLCGGISAFTKEEWRKELDEMYHRLTESITGGDYQEELLDHYSDEVKFFPPGHPVILGKEEFIEYRNANPGQFYMDSWERKEEEILISGPDIAVDWIKFKYRGPDGQHIPGKAILVLKKEDGKAKIRVDIWNADV